MRPSVAVAIASLVGMLPACGRAQDQKSVTPPRLVVLGAVDQLAAWVFAAGRPHLAADGGFARLAREGVTFTHCAYEHACTETGPGHATVGTGVAANVHGIVRNKWWVPAQQKAIYCVEEKAAALPGLPEGKDRGPGLMLAPTLAESVKRGVPGSLAGSVAWKDRSAICMAGPHADLAVWCENATGRFVTNTKWAQTTPQWLQLWNGRAVVDQWFRTRWERCGPDAAYADLVDDRPYEMAHFNGSRQRTLPAWLDGGGNKPGLEYYTQIYNSPFGNTAVRLAAEAMVRGMGLGADTTPDVLCVSFSSTDLVGHYFGPDSVEARDTLLRLDRELATFLQFLDAQVGVGQWAMFLTADHGVGMTPEWAKAQGKDAGRGAIQTFVGAAVEKALRDKFGEPAAGKRYQTHVGEFSIFFDDALLDAVRGSRSLAEVRLEAAQIAAAAATKVPGLAAAYATDDLLAGRVPGDPIVESLKKALAPGRAGEVQLVIKPGWLDGTTPASHGTPHPYDREVVAFAIGGGAPAGVVEDQPITPGFGATWFRARLGLPRAAGSSDTVPASFRLP
ncbi:MAG: alkaline phosphatase family protein [Planctomycetes bacterium]|nr:alkaline phosphatase family protein [Planctomycetota bacterium]